VLLFLSHRFIFFSLYFVLAAVKAKEPLTAEEAEEAARIAEQKAKKNKHRKPKRKSLTPLPLSLSPPLPLSVSKSVAQLYRTAFYALSLSLPSFLHLLSSLLSSLSPFVSSLLSLLHCVSYIPFPSVAWDHDGIDHWKIEPFTEDSVKVAYLDFYFKDGAPISCLVSSRNSRLFSPAPPFP
jgi:hypothetical protein